ncbi:hypothetical protein MKK88_28625 [Methylobacterium sp. E-005]|nr:hypothetical protein [Methylobacterium sp. E-005]MCJ2089923.1 hypothetical protein [Methylobacterium sp. E-005]
MDDEGVDLPDLCALRGLLRRTLTLILKDEGEQTGINEFLAEAYDETGRLVMKARAHFSIIDQ